MMDVDLLLCMLQLMRTLWIGAQFVVIDAHMAAQVHAMIPPQVLLLNICIGEAKLKESVKIVGDSPAEYLYDTIYAEPDMS